MIVVDASILAPAVADDDAAGGLARAHLRHAELAAPSLVDLEVVSVVRRAARANRLSLRRARLALDDLAALPLHRAPHPPLLDRIWALRDDVTVYDASYIALAEALDVVLLTADARLARAPGRRCEVEVMALPSGSGP